jgi:hypothetical protein
MDSEDDSWEFESVRGAQSVDACRAVWRVVNYVHYTTNLLAMTLIARKKAKK